MLVGFVNFTARSPGFVAGLAGGGLVLFVWFLALAVPPVRGLEATRLVSGGSLHRPGAASLS